MTASTVPLSRNRDYRLVWIGQALSEAGSSASAIAFPLLVLVLTGSPVLSGLVLSAGAAAQLLAGLPAGALVDRWDRKKVMLICEAVQALAVGSVVPALWWGFASVPYIIAVVVVLGVCRSLCEPAEEASLPAIVPADQLAGAVAMNSARGYLGQLLGTALGGFLFAARRWLPFAAEAAAHVAAFVALFFVRLPARQREPVPKGNLHREVLDGLRWIGGRPLIRVIAVCAIGLNLFFQAFYLLVIALAQQRGVPTGQIGVMAAMFGAGGILGALAAPRLHRLVRPYVSVVGVFWVITCLIPPAIFADNGYLMGALFAAMAFVAPTANTTITTYQLLLTPDELRGRLSSVMSVALGTAAIAGPALGGLLVEVLPGDQAILTCAAGIALLSLFATFNPTLRQFSAHDPADQGTTTDQGGR
ncbi:putative MFS family arabinose efflux permease [Saccharothrix carnea]|uniref:Putative MFS family arabinose efflux permease n=1 Tax=Saccharothrix carnea TaxID=1280637 RepID=A0A2P8I4C5_SACCR|nr:MFS transporter [Saccharothrix carnea]PSL53322.1 putative MFS family arabinose efflux permease [Saccharothrix carnea]